MIYDRRARRTQEIAQKTYNVGTDFKKNNNTQIRNQTTKINPG